LVLVVGPTPLAVDWIVSMPEPGVGSEAFRLKVTGDLYQPWLPVGPVVGEVVRVGPWESYITVVVEVFDWLPATSVAVELTVVTPCALTVKLLLL
jgi:hypothetical protein